MILAFTLSMPNVGSWDGKWSGENRLHAKVVNFGRSKKATLNAQAILDARSFYYNFGDGWGAEVSVRHVDSKEATKIRKATKGFCGYDWMVDSIINHGKIKMEEK